MKLIFCLFLFTAFISGNRSHAVVSKNQVKGSAKMKEEVLDNPTLKAQSGALSAWSFYSSFTYKGGSLERPFEAQRPNILDASEKPNLQSFSGNFGIKYRLSRQDNLSLQLGAYMAAPFHDTIEINDPRVQKEFDESAGVLDVDDPRLSYFRTYYLGSVQNVTFLFVEKTTKSSLTEFGYDGNFGLSHGAALRIGKSAYVAGTLAYAQAFFDKDTIDFRGVEMGLKPYQTQRMYKAGVSFEYYPVQKLALRAVTDVASYFQMRDKNFEELERRDLQQTLALSYFYTRDIVIAPKVSFNINDVALDKTNLGVSFTVNM